jgi:hypothetical protein
VTSFVVARPVDSMKATELTKCHGRRTKGRYATKQPWVGHLEAELDLEPCNHHYTTQESSTRAHPITRSYATHHSAHELSPLVSQPSIYHGYSRRLSRQTYRTGHSQQGTVSCHQITQPLIHPSSQLASLLRPSILTITNDSWQHRHHAAMREQDGANGESRKPGVSRLDAYLGLV